MISPASGFTESLRRLGQTKVCEWDFKDVIPALKLAANTEIDFPGMFKRAANIKVCEWDFRTAWPAWNAPRKRLEPALASAISFGRAEMTVVTERLKSFLWYVVVSLIDEPSRVQLKVIELGPNGLRFKLVLPQREAMILIGRNGCTAAAVRNVLKAAAKQHGIQVLLQIHSHAEEAVLLAREAVPVRRVRTP